jgi:hypothetical protein
MPFSNECDAYPWMLIHAVDHTAWQNKEGREIMADHGFIRGCNVHEMPFSTLFPDAVGFSIGQRVLGDTLLVHVVRIS